MLLLAKILTVLAVLFTGFKLSVVWYAACDPFDGAGVPTNDFILIYPAYLAFSIDMLLDELKNPLPGIWTCPIHCPFWSFLLYLLSAFSIGKAHP